MTHAVLARIDAWFAAWAAMDVAAMAALCDLEDPQPHYVPEEAEDAPFADWARIERYWREAARLFPQGVELRRTGEACVQDLGDLALVHFPMRFRLVPPGGPGIAGDNRVSQMWRRRAADWRLIQHVEAPPASVPWVMDLAARRARETRA